MIQLDLHDTRPLYEQIKEKTKDLIIKGILSENQKIPSVREAASYLAINPNTKQKAYKELENEGYLYSIRSKGYFVSSVDKVLKDKKISDLNKKLDETLNELICLKADKKQVVSIIKKYYKEDDVND